MKFLVVEDDSNKAKQIADFLDETYVGCDIILKRSYQSGLKELYSNKFDVALLDMQLPTFDITSGEDGYKFRKLAGIDILSELKRKSHTIKIIIVTQFETFGEGESLVQLSDLKNTLKNQYSTNYLDTVYYNASQSSWKKELKNLIGQLHGNG